jgi:hypothetical protein
MGAGGRECEAERERRRETGGGGGGGGERERERERPGEITEIEDAGESERDVSMWGERETSRPDGLRYCCCCPAHYSSKWPGRRCVAPAPTPTPNPPPPNPPPPPHHHHFSLFFRP